MMVMGNEKGLSHLSCETYTEVDHNVHALHIPIVLFPGESDLVRACLLPYDHPFL